MDINKDNVNGMSFGELWQDEIAATSELLGVELSAEDFYILLQHMNDDGNQEEDDDVADQLWPIELGEYEEVVIVDDE